MIGASWKTKILFGGLCSLGVGLSATNILSNSVFIDELKEIIQIYRYGAPVPIPLKVSKSVQSVMDDMQLSQKDRERIKPFTVYGFDIFSVGSTSTVYGAILGIPSNFYYSNICDVDTDNITVLNQPVDWLSKVAKDFKGSLLLSEEAQKFLIAREIASVNSPTVFIKPLYPLYFAFMMYTLSNRIQKKLNLLQKPPAIRGVFYTLVSLFSLGLWTFFHDFTTVNLELEVDKAVCALGEQYVRGGLEAYSKLLQRNISLRELMGSKGPSAYTAVGNEVYFIRQKHLPISNRKSFMEEMLNQSKTEAKAETPENIANSVS